MYTLGLNAAFHDSSACLVKDGVVVAAAEEERFTRIKHAKRPVPFTTYELPYHSIDYCLAKAGITLCDVDKIAYSLDPYLLPVGKREGRSQISLPLEPSAQPDPHSDNPWDPLFCSYIINAPRLLADGYPHHLQDRFSSYRRNGRAEWHFVPHHLAHAASAFFPSPFEEASVLTLDGRGETASTSYSVGRRDSLDLIKQVDLPSSVGLFYENVTSYLGFLHSSDEYKVMALASYGKPVYEKEFSRWLRFTKDGAYVSEWNEFESTLGTKRKKGDPFEKKHFDIAASLQKALENLVLEMVNWFQTIHKSDCLCMAGGVALNCVMNSVIYNRGPYKDVWIQPAAGDAGTALGAALWIDRSRKYRMEHAYLGPDYDDSSIEEFLKWAKVPYRKSNNVAKDIAKMLARDEIVGWFQGSMEFGPRALGARSILASPIRPQMQAQLNELKDREDFRPVAPVVLEELSKEWFAELPEFSPFMLFVAKAASLSHASRIPAAIHVDGTARVQTVSKKTHPLFHRLVYEFYEITGVPVLINTSFNVRGEPIVCSPQDALNAFWSTPLHALSIGSFILEKKPCQPSQ